MLFFSKFLHFKHTLLILLVAQLGCPQGCIHFWGLWGEFLSKLLAG